MTPRHARGKKPHDVTPCLALPLYIHGTVEKVELNDSFSGQ